MRRLVLASAAVALLAPAPNALAAPVLVLDGGRVHTEHDPFVAPTPLDAAPPVARAAQAQGGSPAPGGAPAPAPVAPSPVPPAAAGSRVRAVLAGLLASGQIDQGSHDAKLALWEKALRVRAGLRGLRRRELTAAIGVVGGIAVKGDLTASRLNALFTQLERNTTWWSTANRIPGYGERVRNIDSRVLFQYIPGHGLQLHPLANWGRAASLFNHRYGGQGRAMVNELLAIGVQRGPALTWEYYFGFIGGSPPWVSGLAQGSALEALSSAFQNSRDPRYADAARQALALYDLPTPVGVRVRTRAGFHYAQYSFAPRLRIINGFVQALNGLWDAWHKVGDPRAAHLFRRGDAEARKALRFYDTGRWSRYSNYVLSNVHYHLLLRDFLRSLCRRTGTRAYCAKAARFSYYLRRYGGPPKGARVV